jgi:hypothetical protein
LVRLLSDDGETKNEDTDDGGHHAIGEYPLPREKIRSPRRRKISSHTVTWQTKSNRSRKRRTKEPRTDQNEPNAELAFGRRPLGRCFVNRVPSFHFVPMQANELR